MGDEFLDGEKFPSLSCRKLTGLAQTKQSKKITPPRTVIPPAAAPGTRFPCALNPTSAAAIDGVTERDFASPAGGRRCVVGSCDLSRHLYPRSEDEWEGWLRGGRGTDRVLHLAQTDRLRRISWWVVMEIVVVMSMSIASRVVRARESRDMVRGAGWRQGGRGRKLDEDEGELNDATT
jgi:hypothetical protein